MINKKKYDWEELGKKLSVLTSRYQIQFLREFTQGILDLGEYDMEIQLDCVRNGIGVTEEKKLTQTQFSVLKKLCEN